VKVWGAVLIKRADGEWKRKKKCNTRETKQPIVFYFMSVRV